MSSKFPSDAAVGDKARVGYVDQIIDTPEMLPHVAALFPDMEFVNLGETWPEQKSAGFAAIIVGATMADIDAVIKRLGLQGVFPPTIVAISGADAATTRRLLKAGAADVLSMPVREASLALSLERLMAGRKAVSATVGKVIGIIKAGGGVGATALGTQLAQILATRRNGVCFADLDIQFGQAALKLDIDDAMTITDILGGDGALEEAPLASVLATHASGVRLLAAPRDMTPLEAVSPQNVDGLIKSLRREFSLTLLDLPHAWTAWTNHTLHQCDRIILVTNLTVSHIQLTRRQLKTLSTQGADVIPTTLVCNAVSEDQRAIVSLPSAEKAIGKKFDFVLPEDRKLMNAAVARGCALSQIRAGSKLEKAIEKLADEIDPDSVPSEPKPKRRWL